MQLLTSLLPLEMQLVTCDGSNVMESVCQTNEEKTKTTLLDEEFQCQFPVAKHPRIDGAMETGCSFFYCICYYLAVCVGHVVQIDADDSIPA